MRSNGITKTYMERLSAFKWRKKIVLENFTHEFFAGMNYGIIGVSGSGKSTLAAILSGFEKPDSGSVSYLCDHERVCIRNVFQDTYRLLNPLNTVRWYVESTVRVNGIRYDVRNFMDSVGLPIDIFGDTEVEKLSGGQRQRLSFALAAMQKPHVIILDEPFSMIDSPNVMALLDTLRIWLEDSAVIYIDHNIGRIGYIADYVIAIGNGKIAEEGDVYSVIKNPRTGYVKDLIEAYRELSSFLP